MIATAITWTLLGMLTLVATSTQAAEYYVAPAGDDANPGTQAAPFATLARARQVLRETPNDGPRSVIVAGGTYTLSRPFELEAADSGLQTQPVIWGRQPARRCG